MKNLYIHIGTHKTGSTTIQHALRETSKKSKHNKWSLVTPPNSSSEFMHAKRYNDKLVNKFKLELQSGINRADTNQKLIISSESLSGSPENGYKNSDIVASMLKSATTSYNVIIIIYLRRQDEFIESIYTQKIHQGESLSFNKFKQNFNSTKTLNYNHLLNSFEKNFGKSNIIVRSYHKASENGLLTDFEEAAGIYLLPSTQNKRKNPSYSRNALEIARICNKQLTGNQIKHLRKSLQKTMAKDKNEPFTFFDKNSRSDLLQKHRHSNQEVAKNYFNNNIELLFPSKNITSTSNHHNKLTPESISPLIIELINQQNKKTLITFKKPLTLYRNLIQPSVFKSTKEKELLTSFFKHIKHGFYIDIGANQPNNAVSNIFWNTKWQGFIVEPLPEYAELFRKINIDTEECALTSPENLIKRKMTFSVAGRKSTLNTNHLIDQKIIKRKIQVHVKTLDELIKKRGWSHINLLSIDTEGTEVDVLRGINLDEVKCDLILIEDWGRDLSIHSYLTKHGYKRIRRTGFNSWYIPKEKDWKVSLFGKLQFFRKFILSMPFRKLRKWRHKKP